MASFRKRLNEESLIWYHFPMISNILYGVLSIKKYDFKKQRILQFIIFAWTLPFKFGQSFHYIYFPFKLIQTESLHSIEIGDTNQRRVYIVGTLLFLACKAGVVSRLTEFLMNSPQHVFRHELINSINLICFLVYTSGYQVYTLLHSQKISCMLKEVLKLCLANLDEEDCDDYNMILHNADSDQFERNKDDDSGQLQSAAIILILLVLMMIFTPPVMSLGLFYTLEYEIMFQALQTSSTSLNIVVCGIVCYWISFELVIILCSGHSYIVYASLLEESLRQLRMDAIKSNLEFHVTQSRYRVLQICQALAMDAGAPMVAGVLIGATTFVIAASYILIRFHNILTVYFLLIFATEGITFILAIYLCIKLAIDVREASLLYASNLLKCSPIGAVDRKWLKSLRPIQMLVGNLFPLTTRAFFLEIVSFILENVASILVAF